MKKPNQHKHALRPEDTLLPIGIICVHRNKQFRCEVRFSKTSKRRQTLGTRVRGEHKALQFAIKTLRKWQKIAGLTPIPDDVTADSIFLQLFEKYQKRKFMCDDDM